MPQQEEVHRTKTKLKGETNDAPLTSEYGGSHMARGVNIFSPSGWCSGGSAPGGVVPTALHIKQLGASMISRTATSRKRSPTGKWLGTVRALPQGLGPLSWGEGVLPKFDHTS